MISDAHPLQGNNSLHQLVMLDLKQSCCHQSLIRSLLLWPSRKHPCPTLSSPLDSQGWQKTTIGACVWPDHRHCKQLRLRPDLGSPHVLLPPASDRPTHKPDRPYGCMHAQGKPLTTKTACPPCSTADRLQHHRLSAAAANSRACCLLHGLCVWHRSRYSASPAITTLNKTLVTRP